MQTEQKRIMVIALVAVVLVVTAGVIVFLLDKKLQMNAEAPSQSVSSVPAVSVLPETKVVPKNENSSSKPIVPENAEKTAVAYVNDEYGFQLTLPESWKGYRIMVEKTPFEKGVSYVNVLLPTQNQEYHIENRSTGEQISGYDSLFVIVVWDVNYWNAKKALSECQPPIQGCPDEGSVVGKNTQFVFETGFPNGLPLDDLEAVSRTVDLDFVKHMFRIRE